jgi:hypothetical protein
MLYPTELRYTLLSFAARELRYTLTELPTVLVRTFLQFFIMPECWTVRHRNKGTQVRYQMLRYRTERLDAGIPMPVALASMPMPSYANLQQKGDGLGVFNFVTKHHWNASNFVTPL